jgi:outer membrane lipoprotein SlyB
MPTNRCAIKKGLFRRLRNIDQKTFAKRMASSTSSACCAWGGAEIGAFAGTAICPVFGTFIGALFGGIAGSFFGAAIFE